ncbi:MAG: cysteine desulfurase [Proteobacteria bacterium]|nr:cysteine desulfurase [Pseudomonadota bacterium]
MQIAYLDHNSTTKLAAEAIAEMVKAYQLPLNASSTHKLGRQAHKLVEEARQEIKNLLNANHYEVIFTSSSTEATNTIIRGVAAKKIIFSKIEHAAVYDCRPHGKEIIEIKALENGLIDISDLKNHLEKISDSSFLVSAMLANNETGAIQEVEEIAKLTHQKGGLFHCDIVQAVAKIPVDLEKINADFASISAHKINGPQGVGALLLRKGLEIAPLLVGGKQEKSKRAGTINVAGIIGFGVACKLAKAKIAQYKNVEELRNFLESEIKKIGAENIKIFSTEVARLPNTSYIAIKNADAQTQLINFDLNGICVSAGPACSSGTSTGSRVLKAMNITPEFSNSAIRVSLGTETTEDEIKKFIKVWSEFYYRTYKQ